MPNATLVNFAAGETSPQSRGRFDLDWFRSSCEKLLNFIPEVPGSARYRPAFKVAAETRRGAVARSVPFVLNSSTKYMLEFTAGYMRVYKNGALSTLPRTTITAITRAAQGVITVASTTNLSNDDEVVLGDIEGMPELNGRQVLLANNVGSTYKIKDPVTGSYINTSEYGAYTSGGTVSEVYEIATPYLAADLDNLQWAPDGNTSTMYITCVGYAPRKLVVDASDIFTLSTYSRTNDPFVPTAAISLVSTGNIGVWRSGAAAEGLAGQTIAAGYTVVVFPQGTTIYAGALYTFAAVVGTTEINTGVYTLTVFRATDAIGAVVIPDLYTQVDAVMAVIKTAAGADVNSAAWTAYVSGGTATPATETPIGCAFYESRLWLLGSNQRPNTVFGSRAPDDDGNPRYDDFTGGTAADDACFFALAPASGQVDYLTWGRGTSKFLFAGSFGGPFRISGSGLDEPITPSSINVRQLDLAGCEAVMTAGGARVFFIQRGGTSIRALRYNSDLEDYESYDMMLNAEHIADSPLRRVALQTGRPDILWAIREDGVLVGVTVQGNENVAGWHRHKAGGTDAKFLDVQPLPRTDKNDQLWAVTERVINSVTRRYMEFQTDPVVFPDIEDFYTGPDNRDDDLESWKNAVYRRQEEYIHLDCAGTYNGSDRGTAAAATLTPGALTGDDVAFTASAAVFKSTDVGSELWKKPNRETGVGSGRAVITAYVSTTQVTCDIEVDFDSVDAVAAGAWHFAVDTIYVPHLDRATVGVLIDGAVYSDGIGDVGQVATVDNCKVQLSDVAAVVHVGFPYDGFVKTHNLELTAGGQGPAQAKPRVLSEANIRFLASLGVDYGTDIYDLEQIEWRTAMDAVDRPAPVFSGIRRVQIKDSTSREEGKFIIISQRVPLPCVVQSIDLLFDTTEAG